MFRATATVTAAALMLAGCGSTKGYPSLAKRPQERISGSAPVAPATAAPEALTPPVDPALDSRLAQLRDQARAAHDRFTAQTSRTRQLVNAAQGAAIASESWSVASVALAELESRRSQAMVALGDCDALYVKQRIDGGDGSSIAAVRDQITAWVADEDAVLADLRTRIKS